MKNQPVAAKTLSFPWVNWSKPSLRKFISSGRSWREKDKRIIEVLWLYLGPETPDGTGHWYQLVNSAARWNAEILYIPL